MSSDKFINDCVVSMTREGLVENLYRVFGSYALPNTVPRCTEHVSEEDNQLLRSKPLRELSWKELGYYADQPISEWGTVEVFKHFLPRIFELVLREPYTFPEMVFKKLRDGAWESWLPEEKSAVQTLLKYVWIHGLRKSIPFYIDELVASIAQATDDLEPYLAYWQTFESPIFLEQLDELLTQNKKDLLRGELGIPFLDNDVPKAKEAFIVWLTGSFLMEALEKMLVDDSSKTIFPIWEKLDAVRKAFRK